MEFLFFLNTRVIECAFDIYVLNFRLLFTATVTNITKYVDPF